MLSYISFNLGLEYQPPRRSTGTSQLTARAVCSRSGDARHTEPFDLRKCTDQVSRFERAEDTTINELEAAGCLLGNLLLPEGEVRKRFHEAYARLGESEGLRVRLRCEGRSRPDELDGDVIKRLPWEFARVPIRQGGLPKPLVLDPRLSLVRHEELPAEQSEPELRGALVVRYVEAGEAGGESYRELPREFPKLPGKFGSDLIDQEEIDPDRASLDRELPDGLHVDIFHFSGHGKPKGLVLRYASDRGTDFLTGPQLAELLYRVGVQLAIVSACHSGATSDTDTVAGVAQALVKVGIPIVIAMQHRVGAPNAKEFAETFYRELLSGVSVDEAVAKARSQLSHGVDWGRPVLHHRSSRGLFLTAQMAPAVLRDDHVRPSGPATDDSDLRQGNGRVREPAAGLSRDVDRTWWVQARPGGPAMNALRDGVGPRATDGIGLAVSPDGRAVVQWAGAGCTGAWIIPRTARLSEHWPHRPSPLDDAELLAMTTAGSDRVELILTTARRTFRVWFGPDGFDGDPAVLVEQPSRAAVYLHGTTPCTVDPNGQVREHVLRRALPPMAEVTALDAVYSAGHTLLAALGLAPNGRPILATSVDENPSVVLDDVRSGVLVERQHDPARRPSWLLLDPATTVDAGFIAGVREA